MMLQKKAVRIINFQQRNSRNSGLLKQSFTLKFQEKICLETILFVSKSLNSLSPSGFNTWFSFSSDKHKYESSSSTENNLTKLYYKANRYGKYLTIVIHTSFFKKFYKKNLLVFYLMYVKGLRLSLALLYSYYPLALENTFIHILLLLL